MGTLSFLRFSGWIGAILFSLLFAALLKEKEKNKGMALYDYMTNLPNRRLLDDRMERMLSHCKREKKTFAIIYIDLDGFKNINDQYGHKIGDSLLLEASKRMLACVRVSDTVSRIGGDEFIILLNNIYQCPDIQKIHNKLSVNLNTTINIDGSNIELSASLGVAVYPEDGETLGLLIKSADHNMYRDKQHRKSTNTTFTNGVMLNG